MTAYAAYYDRGWNILEFDASKARRLPGGSLLYQGWIYGPADECFTSQEGALLWIQKEYHAARAYQKRLEELQAV